MNFQAFVDKKNYLLKTKLDLETQVWAKYVAEVKDDPEHFFDWHMSSAWTTSRLVPALTKMTQFLDTATDKGLSAEEQTKRLCNHYVHLCRLRARRSLDRTTNFNRAVAYEVERETTGTMLQLLADCQDMLPHFPDIEQEYRLLVDSVMRGC